VLPVSDRFHSRPAHHRAECLEYAGEARTLLGMTDIKTMRWVIAVGVLAVGGCALFPPLPPETPLAVSWRRYQSCVTEYQQALTRCERLRLAYEAQLDRAER
jgi:hypothetical protein